MEKLLKILIEICVVGSSDAFPIAVLDSRINLSVM
jgi:hypothetical protein